MTLYIDIQIPWNIGSFGTKLKHLPVMPSVMASVMAVMMPWAWCRSAYEATTAR